MADPVPDARPATGPETRPETETGATPWGDGCPSENHIAELAQGLVGPDLRDQVITHLDTCPSCTTLLTELALVLAPEAPEAPRKIGRYEVVEQLGAGGMGVVYLAVDAELKRRVALKLIRADLLDSGDASSIRARLVREAQLLAALTHPNVVAVHDVGEVDGDVFIAMEYVEGQPVSDWLTEESRDWKTIVDAYDQAGRGLAAAHALDIVHRDVKPSNLLVGADGRVRLTDFGLATTHREETPSGEAPTVVASEGRDAPLTQAGAVLGTPAYMAPEQRSGAAGPLADQFSFCLCLYEALAGARPVLRDDHWAAAPSPGALGDVPSGVRDAVLRGLSLDPAERFEDVMALLQALASKPALASGRVGAPRSWGVAVIVGALIVAGALITGALLLRKKPDSTTSKAARSATARPSTAGPDASHAGATAPPVVLSRSDATIHSSPALNPSVASPSTNSAAGAPRSRAAAGPSNKGAPPSATPLVSSAQLKKHRRVAKLITQAQAAFYRRQGKVCLDRLRQAEKLVPNRGVHDQFRGWCTMLVGRCAAGTRILRAYHRRKGWNKVQSDSLVQRATRFYCPSSGAKSPKQQVQRLKTQIYAAYYGGRPKQCARLGATLWKAANKLKGTTRSALKYIIINSLRGVANCLGKAGQCKSGRRWFLRSRHFHLGASPKTDRRAHRDFSQRHPSCAGQN